MGMSLYVTWTLDLGCGAKRGAWGTAAYCVFVSITRFSRHMKWSIYLDQIPVRPEIQKRSYFYFRALFTWDGWRCDLGSVTCGCVGLNLGNFLAKPGPHVSWPPLILSSAREHLQDINHYTRLSDNILLTAGFYFSW